MLYLSPAGRHGQFQVERAAPRHPRGCYAAYLLRKYSYPTCTFVTWTSLESGIRCDQHSLCAPTGVVVCLGEWSSSTSQPKGPVAQTVGPSALFSHSILGAMGSGWFPELGRFFREHAF